MKVGAVSSTSNYYTFKADSKPADKSKSPISKSGEKAKLAAATFVAGLGLGAKLLFELMDGDFIIEDIGEAADKIVKKQHKNASGSKKFLLQLGAFGGILAAFVGAVALLYTLFKAPNINYQGNINAFKKGKDMDVYIKGNDTEKEIYTQMNEKAKNATPEEKAKLQEQYLKMQMAKNRVPEFVRNL